MSTIAEKIKAIEDEMARTQKNKATSGHLGLLKAKIAKLKKELITPKSSGGGGGEGFDVKATGDARVGLIGFPSVGKSTLMSKLTGVESLAAGYEFTTLTCIPGEFHVKGCRIQLLDLPGIIEGAKDGKGRGRQVIGVARSCGLIMIVLDVSKPLTHKLIIERELEGFGIRLNKQPPNITLRKLNKGGCFIVKPVKQTHLDDKTITSICKMYGYNSVEVTLRCDATDENLIDACIGTRHFVPCLYVLNKIDAISIEELDILSRIPNCICISSKHGWNLDELKDRVWTYLDMIRVYTKPKGQLPDYSDPVMMMKRFNTVEDFCRKIHKTLVNSFTFAWVWGNSVKHDPQKVGRDHRLLDEDVVQIVKKI